MYACMTPVGFDTSDKFENHCYNEWRGPSPWLGAWAAQLLRNVAAVSAVVKDITIGARGGDSIPVSVKPDTVLQTARHHCNFLGSCADQALSRGDGPRHSLNALA